MASAAYNEWVSRVKAAGGRVTVAPSGATAAAFPNNVRGALSSQDLATQPAETSRNGAIAYFHAPQWVQVETGRFTTATQREARSARDQLLEEWGVPNALRGVGPFLSELKVLVVLAIATFILAAWIKGRSR